MTATTFDPTDPDSLGFGDPPESRGIMLEEARAILTDQSFINWLATVNAHASVALRLLLASEASAEARLDEAARLMEPFASYDYPAADGWGGHDKLALHMDGQESLINRFTVEHFRALSAFLAREKANG